MADLGDLENLAKEADQLIGDHPHEVKPGLDQAADLIQGDNKGTAHNLASRAAGLLGDDKGDKGDKAKPKTKKPTKKTG